MPTRQNGDPLPSPEPPSRPEDRVSGTGRLGQRADDGRYMDTHEAAARLGLAPTTLVRYRITGKGPCRYRFVTMFATIVLVLLIGVLAWATMRFARASSQPQVTATIQPNLWSMVHCDLIVRSSGNAPA